MYVGLKYICSLGNLICGFVDCLGLLHSNNQLIGLNL